MVPAGSLGGLHEATLGPHTVFKIKVNLPSNVSKALTLFSMRFTVPGKGTPAINVLEREWTEVHDRRYGEVAVYSMETIHFKCMLNDRNVACTSGKSQLLLMLLPALPRTVVISCWFFHQINYNFALPRFNLKSYFTSIFRLGITATRFYPLAVLKKPHFIDQ